jgi:hypothetical protein
LEGVVNTRLTAAVRSLITQLPDRLRYVIMTRYGLPSSAPQSITHIGQALGVTRRRTQQLHAEALLCLAHSAHSLDLYHLLDRNTTAGHQALLAQQRRWLHRRRARWAPTPPLTVSHKHALHPTSLRRLV